MRPALILAFCLPLSAQPLRVTLTDPVGCTVENEFFLADLSKQIVDGREQDSGTLRALTLKFAGVRLERRHPIRMHWAPSFQRAGSKSYTSIAAWGPVQKFTRDVSPSAFVFRRQGYQADYPEIHLDASYRFLPGVPYFLFRSVMTIERPIEIFWLRNQEMTMNDLFTHAAWPTRDGSPRIAAFAERHETLRASPIPVDTPWMCFVNLEKGYGYGAVVLDYKATTTVNPITSINDGADNGKYWDRRLVDQVNTRLRPGDRYEEHTAYVVFRVRRDTPLAEFLDWEKRLRRERP